jgi:hypothetical protein
MVTADVMNSPASQNEIVGATVIRKTTVEMRNTTAADTRCQILKFMMLYMLMKRFERRRHSDAARVTRGDVG